MSAKNHPRRKRLDRARRDGHFEARCKKQIPEKGDENALPNFLHFGGNPFSKKQIPEKGDENVSKISADIVPVLKIVKNRSPKKGTKTDSCF